MFICNAFYFDKCRQHVIIWEILPILQLIWFCNSLLTLCIEICFGTCQKFPYLFQVQVSTSATIFHIEHQSSSVHSRNQNHDQILSYVFISQFEFSSLNIKFKLTHLATTARHYAVSYLLQLTVTTYHLQLLIQDTTARSQHLHRHTRHVLCWGSHIPLFVCP